MKTRTEKRKLRNYGRKLISKQRKNLRQKITEGKVINLSSKPLTNSETNLLSEGLTFCPKPRINKDDIQEDIDEFIRIVTWKEHFAPKDITSDYEEPYSSTVLDRLNDKKKRPRKQSKKPPINALHSTIFKDIDSHWKTTSPTKDNLSKRERKALQWLKNRKDIAIKKADKGGATV